MSSAKKFEEFLKANFRAKNKRIKAINKLTYFRAAVMFVAAIFLITFCVAGSTDAEALTGSDEPTLSLKNVTTYLDSDGMQKVAPDSLQRMPLNEAKALELGTAGKTSWYLVSGLSARLKAIKFSGDAHLILEDKAFLNVDQIQVDSNSTLTVYGQSFSSEAGTIKAGSDESESCSKHLVRSKVAIGWVDGSRNSRLIINGGNITAVSNEGKAAIGGDGMRGCGNAITINNGNVRAVTRSCYYGGAAAIGCSYRRGGISITITGGKVTAITSYEDGVMVGSGEDGDPCEIKILGGYLTSGTRWDGGIGSYNEGGSILIENATVTTRKIGFLRGATRANSLQIKNSTLVILDDVDIRYIDKTSWSGLVAVVTGSSAIVYGSPTLVTDFSLSRGYEIAIGKSQVVTIGNNCNAEIKGISKIMNEGTLVNNGTLKLAGNAVVQNSKEIFNSGEITLNEDAVIVGQGILRHHISKAACKYKTENKYEGLPVVPKVFLTWNDKALQETKDYTVKYQDNNKPGEGFLIISGIGEYFGEVTKPFNIFKKDSAGQPGGDKDNKPMFRLYNRWSGEHFYTGDLDEQRDLVRRGWIDEGVGWLAPVEDNGLPVYRLYNKWSGDHHFTMDASERQACISAGWNDEGVGWYSAASEKLPVYREYNPYAKSFYHNYTADVGEHDNLTRIGWLDEGIGWYGC